VLLRDYYKQTEEGLDDDDIKDLIDSKFGYDEDLDDDSLVKKQKLAKKENSLRPRSSLKNSRRHTRFRLSQARSLPMQSTMKSCGLIEIK
jgi:hypothetical protein